MLETVVVALDCSETSDKVLDALKKLKLSGESKLILTHIFTMVNEDEIIDQPTESSEARLTQVEQKLLQYQAQFAGSVIEMTKGDPADEIVRLANIYQAHLIVIGTRGLRGVNRIISDSVSSSVVENAPCSVFIVKE
ncbi:MAG: universal stress protein [Microcystaceae cyanobacterium]